MEVIKSENKTIEYDLYGIVGIRLVNPAENDVKNLSSLYHSFRTELNREPDIIIRYRKDWQIGDISYVGVGEAGFNDDGFYILSNGRLSLKTKIPFEQIGDKCELVCDQGIGEIPLLNRIISLTFLKKKYLPIHASAFLYNDVGALVIGWSKGGKSESLFSFMKKGARFVGDETVIISSDGKKMFGIPVPVSVWEWQLPEIRELIPPINITKKILFKTIHFIDNIYKAFNKSFLKNNSIIKLIGKALPVLKKLLNIRIEPEVIFNGKVQWTPTNLNKLVIIMSHNKDDIKLTKYNKNDIAAMMITSNLYELDYFYNYYSKFKFAFPGIKNDFLENVGKIYNNLLPSAISGIDVYKVLHAYPVSFEKLFIAMKPIFSDNNKIN